MLNAATGFAVIGLAIAVGYVIGRINLLGPQAGPVLGRLVFFVLSPVLLFVVLSEADIATLFSALLPVSTNFGTSSRSHGTMTLIYGSSFLLCTPGYSRPLTGSDCGPSSNH